MRREELHACGLRMHLSTPVTMHWPNILLEDMEGGTTHAPPSQDRGDAPRFPIFPSPPHHRKEAPHCAISSAAAMAETRRCAQDGEFKKAAPEEIAKRRIVKARRGGAAVPEGVSDPAVASAAAPGAAESGAKAGGFSWGASRGEKCLQFQPACVRNSPLLGSRQIIEMQISQPTVNAHTLSPLSKGEKCLQFSLGGGAHLPTLFNLLSPLVPSLCFSPLSQTHSLSKSDCGG